MASITKYRSKWLKYHTSYEKRAFKTLRKQFNKWNNKVFALDFNENNINKQLIDNIDSEDMFDTYHSIYFSIGSIHGNRVGKDINGELRKDFTIANFMELFEQNLPLFLNTYGVTRIQQIHQTYLTDIFNMFNQRLKDGLTLAETTAEVFAVMRSPRFYRWQAKRIARTETTAAANYSAVQAGSVSGYVMEKLWISAMDARTRDDHSSTNGQKRPEKSPFSVGGESLMYPGDPNGSAANVVNCRCTVAVVPKKDANGGLIRIIN